MKNFIVVLGLLLLVPTLLESQLANRPRNPIMVINCETIDLHPRRNLIQVRENGECSDGYLYINGYCYLIIAESEEEILDCELPDGFPDEYFDGWAPYTFTVTDFNGGSDYYYYCILVPDCNGSVGCEVFECLDLAWDFEDLVCLCYEDEGDPISCCPEVMLDPEKNLGQGGIGGYIETNAGCLERLEDIDCYDGDFEVRFPQVSCMGFQPGDRILFTILIIASGDAIGEALTIEELVNCDLAGGQNFVLALLASGIGDAGWVFKDGMDIDESLAGFGVIEIEFFRDPFAPSILYLTNREPIIIPACSQQIPTTSTWGLIILCIGFMILGGLYYRRRWVSLSL